MTYFTLIFTIMLFYRIFTSNFVIAQERSKAQGPGNGVVASEMSSRLKSELLANLNKYSGNGATDELEVLGSNSNSESPSQTHQKREPEPFWEPPTTTPSLLQSLFGGLFSLPTLPPLFAPATLPPPPSTPPIRNFFDRQIDLQPWRENRFAGAQNLYTVTVTPIPLTLPTFPTILPPDFGFSLGVPYAPRYRHFDEFDHTEFARFTTTTEPITSLTLSPSPRYINYTNISRPKYITDTIRDWRKRFYKLFKSLRHSNRTVSDGIKSRQMFEPVSLTTVQNEVDFSENEPLPRPDEEPQPIMIFQRRPLEKPPIPPDNARRMQPIAVINDSRAAEVDKNRQILMSERNPNWLSEQKVKTFARDRKGRIVRLFGIENGGYKFAKDEEISPPPSDPQNSDYYSGNAVAPPGGTVYIPAASPNTSPTGYRIYRPAPPPVTDLPYQTLATAAPYIPQLISPLPLSPVELPTLVTTPSPCSATTLAYSNRFDTDRENDYDLVDDLPCETMSCQNNMAPNNLMNSMFHANDVGPPFVENNERCNSLRLRYIIQDAIVSGDAETSKRNIQARAETELMGFYNVICGTGFFSYIAHTDEFCQASAADINCYVFSPVCSYKSLIGEGILMKSKAKKRRRKLRMRKKAFLNKN